MALPGRPCRESPGGLLNSDSEAAGLGWGLGFCTFKQLPDAAGTTCCEASGKRRLLVESRGAASSSAVWLFQEAVGQRVRPHLPPERSCCPKLPPLGRNHLHTRGRSLDFQLTGLYQLPRCDTPDLLQMTQKSIPKRVQPLTGSQGCWETSREWAGAAG